MATVAFIVQIVLQRRWAAQAAGQREDAAVKVAQVEKKLAATEVAHSSKLDAIQETVDGTHKLVNNQHAQLLRAFAETLARLAGLTGSVVDWDAARAAAAEADEHDRKQAAVDARGKTPQGVPSR